MVVAASYAIYRLASRSPRFVMARAPALYAIGTVAAYWSIGRMVAIFA
jgi:hypothetical protein